MNFKKPELKLGLYFGITYLIISAILFIPMFFLELLTFKAIFYIISIPGLFGNLLYCAIFGNFSLWHSVCQSNEILILSITLISSFIFWFFIGWIIGIIKSVNNL